MLAANLSEVERMAEHELHLDGELGYVLLAAPDPDDGLQRRFALDRAHRGTGPSLAPARLIARPVEETWQDDVPVLQQLLR